MEIVMDVDAALSEVPVNIMPLIDDTDFKTRETGITYNQAGMDLVWNFVTPAGAYTQTAVTPTTAGTYDWTHQGDGMYTIEIPASAGASINNDTEGFGWFTGVCTGVLPWRGPIICFRAAGLNDKLIESAYDTNRGLAGLALPAAAAEAAGGLFTRGTGAGQINQDANGRVDGNLAAWRGTQPNTLTSGRVETLVGAVSNGVIAAASFAANALDAVWSTATRTLTAFDNSFKTGYSLSAGGIQAIWDALTSALTTTGSIGKLIVDNLNAAISSRSSHSAADVWAVGTRALTDKAGFSLSSAGVQAIWDALTSALSTVNSIGALLVANIDAAISSRSSHSASDVWAVATRTLTAFAFNVTVGTNNDKTGYSLSSAGNIAIWDVLESAILGANGIGVKLKNTLPVKMVKNTAFANFHFVMVDTAGDPATGLTVTATRLIDSGTFAACANSVVEEANGVYRIDLAAADLNGDSITLRFTATGAKTRLITLLTQPAAA